MISPFEHPQTPKLETDPALRDSWEDLMAQPVVESVDTTERVGAVGDTTSLSEDERRAFRAEAAKILAEAAAQDAARTKAITEGLDVEGVEQAVEAFERHKSTQPPAKAEDDTWSKLAA
jgi:hypothetical protein